MPKRKTPLQAELHYHIYNRAVSGDRLFHSSDHDLYFVALMKESGEVISIVMVACCLMPNHFHLLLRSESDGTISRFMQGSCSAYTQARNHRLGREGPLFAGRFQAVPGIEEDYSVQLARYIHRNPVAAQLASKEDDWAFSNYLDVIGKRSGELKDDSLVPTRFATSDDYRAFVEATEIDHPGGFWEHTIEGS